MNKLFTPFIIILIIIVCPVFSHFYFRFYSVPITVRCAFCLIHHFCSSCKELYVQMQRCYLERPPVQSKIIK